MNDHLISWTIGVVVGVLAALATRVQILPDVIDLSILTGAGFGSLLAYAIGAACRLPLERVARVALLGTLVGGGLTAAIVLLALIL